MVATGEQDVIDKPLDFLDIMVGKICRRESVRYRNELIEAVASFDVIGGVLAGCRADYLDAVSPSQEGRPNLAGVSHSRLVIVCNHDHWRTIKVVGKLASPVSRTFGIAGGGELKIKGTNGQVRAQDTVPNGNDPVKSKG